MYRHSLFYLTVPIAYMVEDYIKKHFDVLDIFPTNDGESRHIELRFWTKERIESRQEAEYIRSVCPVIYTLNHEEKGKE